MYLFYDKGIELAAGNVKMHELQLSRISGLTQLEELQIHRKFSKREIPNYPINKET